jgi:uncharacterized protein (DUF1697 family)
MTVHVALLRGINVGGKNKLPMRELAAMFEAAGCTDVKTYIASGNVIFKATAAVARTLAAKVEKQIAKDHGLRVPVVVRTAKELASAVENNPYVARDDHSHVLFLAERPTKAAVAGLDANRSPGDEFAVIGRDVFLYCPNGVAKTKLTNDYFDRKLATTSTGRNFRTVRKLVEMSAALAER